MIDEKYCDRCFNRHTHRCTKCTALSVNDTQLTPSLYIEDDEEDKVNHPSHYKTKSGLETIDVIEAFTDGLKGMEAVDTANVIKYICRWKYKNGIEDLKKAQWYINHLIKHLEGKGEK